MIGNIGPIQLAIVLLIVLLIFGTKRIRSLGSDLGGAIKEFRKGMGDETTPPETPETPKASDNDTEVSVNDASDDSSSSKH